MVIKPIVALLVFCTTGVYACESSGNRPTETKIIFFEKNSATVPTAGIADLASWAVDMKIKYPIHLWTAVVGTAAPNEQAPSKLAARRTEEVRNLAAQFGIVKEQGDVKSYVDNPNNAQVNGKFASSVQIDLSPGCAGNCCDGQ
jgi:hypothetical protein